MPSTQFVRGVAFTPEDEPALYGRDGPAVVGGPPDELYFPRSGRKVTSKLFAAQPGANFVGFGDDGSIIMTARNELAFGQDRVYVQSPDGDVRRLGGYRGRVASAAFVAGRARVVTVSGRMMRVADARSSPNFAALRAHVRSVGLAGFSPDNRTVLTVGHDGKGRLWDLQTGRLRQTLAITEEILYEGTDLYDMPKRAAFQADGMRLVIANDKGEIQTWDVETGRRVCTAPGQSTEANNSLSGIAFLAGGDYVMAAYSRSATENSFINYLDARTCKLAGTFKFNKPDVSVLFSRDGTAMLTGTYFITSIWDMPEMEWWSLRGVGLQGWEPTRLPSPGKDSAPGHPHGLSFVSPLTFDATRVLGVKGDDGYLWVLGGDLPVRLEGRRGDMSGAFQVVLSADGTRVAAVSWREARVWDARSGKLLLAFECDLEVNLDYPVSLSPDGSKLLIAGKDNTVRIYPTSREGFLGAARRLLSR